ncbi:MAG: 1-acyl-sn-glycerol-3-phosphate acyltransferase [Spirochaetaceae bacterium]|jgi:1-acyl-sn-glycerol-3-phosphate acyltransferase|nr:1-acyl-sn-glycerol-3-phosphate acyltransferase [Spirochaetaceae bacterium]GMO18388.1 MAG: hypothetical protein Pg6A_05140 [Termitinemataceae bacterium]
MAYKRGAPLINLSRFFRIASAVVFYFTFCIAMTVCVLLYSVRYINKKLLLRFKGSAILVSNHTSLLDPVMITGAVFPRLLYETMLEATVETPVFGTFTRLLGGVPLPAGVRGLEKILQTAPDAFRYRSFLHFYSEGECFLYNQKIMPFKPGAFYLAASLNIPVIPVVNVLEEGFFAKGHFFARRFPKARYVVLNPVAPSAYVRYKEDGSPEKKSVTEFSEAVRSIMQNEIDSRRAKNPRCGTMAYYKGQMPRIKGLNDDG